MQRRSSASGGMTMPEVLLSALMLGLMAAVGVGGLNRCVARTRVDSAARQLALGLEQARDGALAQGQPCALALGPSGWNTSGDSGDSADGAALAALPPCRVVAGPLPEAVTLRHNLAAPLRISSNGLVLDGGTVVLTASGTELQRCVVVSLPLGIVRLGRNTGSAATAPRSSECLPDPSL